MIRMRLIGTMTARRAFAFWREPNSPAHSIRYPVGSLIDVVDIARVEAVSGGFRPVYHDVQVRLAQNPEDAEIGDPFHLVHDRKHLGCDLFQSLEVGTDDLDRVRALDAG